MEILHTINNPEFQIGFQVITAIIYGIIAFFATVFFVLETTMPIRGSTKEFARASLISLLLLLGTILLPKLMFYVSLAGLLIIGFLAVYVFGVLVIMMILSALGIEGRNTLGLESLQTRAHLLKDNLAEKTSDLISNFFKSRDEANILMDEEAHIHQLKQEEDKNSWI